MQQLVMIQNLLRSFRMILISRRVARLGIFVVVSFQICAFAVLSQVPGSAAEPFQRGVEALKSGQLKEAEKGFAAAIKLSPAFAEAYLNLGLVLEEQGRHPEASTNLKKALALKPRLHGANLFLGLAEYRLDRLDAAAESVTKETAAFPKDAAAWMWLGVIRLAQEKPQDAAAALDTAAKLAPDDPDILYHRGRAHLLVSKDSFEKMYAAAPKSWRVHQVLAQADAEAEKHPDSVREYEAAIRLAPTQPGLHAEFASELIRAGKLDAAVTEFEKELQIDPYNALARFKLGVILVETDDGTRGKSEILKALEQKKDLPNADYYSGRAEVKLANYGAAVEDFKKALKSSSDPELIQLAWYQLAICYRRLQRNPEAQQALAEFQRLKAESSEKRQEQLVQKRNDLLLTQPDANTEGSENPQ